MNKFLSTCLLISTICALKTFSSSPKDYVVFPKIYFQKDSARIYLTFQLEDQYKKRPNYNNEETATIE